MLQDSNKRFNLANMFLEFTLSRTALVGSRDKVFLQYRGKPSKDYVQSLRRLSAPCKVVLTLQKFKTVLPLLKVDVEKRLQRCVVYNLLLVLPSTLCWSA